MKEKYDLSFEEAQDLESKTGLDVYLNDGDIFINENDITRTIGNVLQFGIDYQKAIDDAHLESVVKQWKAEEEMWIKQEQNIKQEMIEKACKAHCSLCIAHIACRERGEFYCSDIEVFRKAMEK